MSYVVNNHLNNLYALSNKVVGPTSIPEARVGSVKKVIACGWPGSEKIWARTHDQ